MRIFIMGILVVAGLSATSASATQGGAVSREEREIALANDGILTSLLVARHPSGQYFCVTSKYACIGPDKAELSLALIGARDTNASMRLLSEILQYKIDGALSEDFTCYVLSKKKKMIQFLRQVDARALVEACRERVRVSIKANAGLFDGIDINSICASDSEITSKKKELIDELRMRKMCSPEDF